jgi:hypothetical protein
MANHVITELARNARESFDKLLNAVEQHEAVQRDLPDPDKANKPAADPNPDKASKPAADPKSDKK